MAVACVAPPAMSCVVCDEASSRGRESTAASPSAATASSCALIIVRWRLVSTNCAYCYLSASRGTIGGYRPRYTLVFRGHECLPARRPSRLPARVTRLELVTRSLLYILHARRLQLSSILCGLQTIPTEQVIAPERLISYLLRRI